jgi:DEAD/DEAH box helicase domain-containing protein
MEAKSGTAISDYIGHLKQDREFGGDLVHHRYLPSRPAVYGPSVDFQHGLNDILRRLGIDRLYSHQVEAINDLRQGCHVVVATPTASGKSLIYNLAVLDAVLKNPDTRALYVFPLKALEHDQMKNLLPWLSGVEGQNIKAEIYDGDTSAHKRKKIRSSPPQILFSTPDMLHHAVLAHHEGWEIFLRGLSFVVLDEVHTYRGIFGSHVNEVIRRLKRLCAHYGSRPRFILLSATVGNPKEFAESLVEEEVQLVASMGAPIAGRHFVFMNPTASPNFVAAKLLTDAIRRGFRTIAFTQSRKVAELIHIWVTRLYPRLAEKMSSYRAGFMPEERREIEQGLAKGNLLGVVSTSALEMGIDIGDLDICLLVGYPGTVINTWQRGGRVGRAGRESAVVVIAKPDALDQYFMKHPDDFFGRPCEAAILDPNNPYVISAHLPCAAAERPLTLRDEAFWPKDLTVRLEALEKEGALRRTADGEPTWFSAKRNPHRDVNMRSAGLSFTILEQGSGKPMGTVDGIRAFKECHPGAVYLHRGRQYLIDDLDISKRNISAHAANVQYFTRVKTDKETEILRVHRSRPEGQFIVRQGELKVTEVVTGYEKRGLPGQTLVGTAPLELPPQIFETVGLWIEIEDAIQHFVEKEGLHFMGGIHAIEHGAIGMFPLFCLCDRNDIGGISYTHHPEVGKSAIFIYDGYPGGVGLAQHGFTIILDLLRKTRDLIKGCACEEGCPSCIHSPKCGSGNKPLDKAAALLILDCLLGDIPLRGLVETDPEQTRGAGPLRRVPASEETREPRIVFFDLETQKTAADVGGWQNTHLMRISVSVVFDSAERRFFVYLEADTQGLVAHLEKANLVVGFNVKQFDYTVLGAYTNRPLRRLPTFDILEDVYRRLGFRLSLDHLGAETLKRPKTADGLQAVEWFRQGEIGKLTEYCTNDVAITRDLFLHGLKSQHLVYKEKRSDQRLRLPVDWEIEKIISAAKAAL